MKYIQITPLLSNPAKSDGAMGAIIQIMTSIGYKYCGFTDHTFDLDFYWDDKHPEPNVEYIKGVLSPWLNVEVEYYEV